MTNDIPQYTFTDIARLIRIDHMNKEGKFKIITLLLQYPEIIKGEHNRLTATTLLKHKIMTKDDNPVYTRTYRYPEIFKQDVATEIDKLLRENIIRYSNSPYNSSIWTVPKNMDASGKWKIQVVIHYRTLNEKTIDNKFPKPNIEDFFNKNRKVTYFSSIDITSGFYQIEVKPNSPKQLLALRLDIMNFCEYYLALRMLLPHSNEPWIWFLQIHKIYLSTWTT